MFDIQNHDHPSRSDGQDERRQTRRRFNYGMITGSTSFGLFLTAVLVSGWLMVFSDASTGFRNPPPTFGYRTTKTTPEDSNTSNNNSSSPFQDTQTVHNSVISSNGTSLSSPSAEVNTNTNSSLNSLQIPEWKQRLPAALHNKTKTLQRLVIPGPNGRTVQVYLLGTAHVSMDSSRDVQLLLEAVQPNVLFLELCDQRIPMMITPPPPIPNTTQSLGEENKHANAINDAHNDRSFPRKIFEFWKRPRGACPNQKQTQSSPSSDVSSSQKSMYGMAATLLTNMQQDYASSLGVELGGEFRVAYRYWEQHIQNTSTTNNNIHMILGDRPLYLTLTRAWESLHLWGKVKLLFGLLISSFQKPNPEELREWMQKILSDDHGDLLSESIAELAHHFPTLERVIIQERDAYMACKLYQTCRQLLLSSSSTSRNRNNDSYNNGPTQTVVAIVGAGHVKGVCWWLSQGNGKQPEEILEPLIQIKKPISEQEREVLIYDVMEVNHELLQDMMQGIY